MLTLRVCHFVPKPLVRHKLDLDARVRALQVHWHNLTLLEEFVVRIESLEREEIGHLHAMQRVTRHHSLLRVHILIRTCKTKV